MINRGGIMMLHQQDKDIFFNKVDTKHIDILYVWVTIRGWEKEILAVFVTYENRDKGNFRK